MFIGFFGQRLQGREVFFITGTDEHGEKIALSAAAKGRAPKEHCDLVAAEYQALWNDVRSRPFKYSICVAFTMFSLVPA